MRFFVSVDAWKKALIAALALSPVAACGSTGGGTGGNGGGTATGTTAKCKDPVAQQAQGKDTGFEACTGQWKHRPSIVECPTALPRPTPSCSLAGSGGAPTGAEIQCTQDSDCTGSPNGFCYEDNSLGFGCYCSYGCTKDADCAAGQICECDDTVGHCANAACKSDADCGNALCATYVTNPGCGGTAYACQNPLDECTGDGDCPQGQMCTLSGDHRICQSPQCVIGRPFLVAGEERLAPIARRGDWRASGLAPCLDGISAEDREALAARWAEVGLMEHASVAAFARFVLQLLSLGAPPDLVRDAQTAMMDETRHAEICFALASGYAGAPVGPGPLAIDRAMEASDARSILITAILEGCVGETVAAIEAAEMAAHATDPAVREALTGIAADETRHAELAWKFVRWAIDGNADLAEAARATFARALGAAPIKVAAADEGALIAHGMATEGVRREIRRRAIEGVVGPCAQALLASRPVAVSAALHA